MPKLEIRTAVKAKAHYVELLIDGVIFETKCTDQEKAQALVLKISRALKVKL